MNCEGRTRKLAHFLGLVAVSTLFSGSLIVPLNEGPGHGYFLSVHKNGDAIDASSPGQFQNADLNKPSDPDNWLVEFIQITDTHVSIDKPQSLDDFENVVNEVNSWSPDFVIITGDLVDWSARPNLEEFHKIYVKIEAPAFVIVGNHDYRDTIFDVIWPGFPLGPWKPDKGALKYYYQNLSPYADPSFENYRENWNLEFGPSEGDFSFDYGPVHMVLLDSGHDLIIEGPGVDGSGLTDVQMEWLREDLKDEENIYIAMHHPVFNQSEEGKKMGPFTLKTPGCITNNREEFIDLAENHQVIAVLAGDTHKEENFLYRGTRYIQTPNDPAFRIIRHKENGKMETLLTGAAWSPSNPTIHTLSQVWCGIQWTHIKILRDVGEWLEHPLNLAVLASGITVVIIAIYWIRFRGRFSFSR